MLSLLQLFCIMLTIYSAVGLFAVILISEGMIQPRGLFLIHMPADRFRSTDQAVVLGIAWPLLGLLFLLGAVGFGRPS